jgi:hypothetical protein
MNKESGNADDVLKKIEEFEKTISQLAQNVASLKKKLLENKEKFGPDMSKWPKT